MTQTSVAAIPVGSDMSDLDLVLLDQDVVELFDDVDAILCAAAAPTPAGAPRRRVCLLPASVRRPVLR